MDPSVPDIAAIVNFGIGLENGTRYRWDPKAQAVPAEVQLAVRRHYFAAITWMDSLVGDLVTELDKLELTSSTIVIFHADHGALTRPSNPISLPSSSPGVVPLYPWAVARGGC